MEPHGRPRLGTPFTVATNHHDSTARPPFIDVCTPSSTPGISEYAKRKEHRCYCITSSLSGGRIFIRLFQHLFPGPGYVIEIGVE